MGLWDALSGKVWHWNVTRLEAHKIIYPRLQGYPTEKYGVRDFLYAYYYAFFNIGVLFFSEDPDIRGRNYIRRLKSINSNGVLTLASSYCCDFVIRFHAGYGEDAIRTSGAHTLVEACQLYAHDRNYTVERLDAYTRRDLDVSARLLVADVALVLGLDSASEFEMSPWLVVRGKIDATTLLRFNEPNWSTRVTRELSRPPRIGGYPDSIMT